MSSKSVHIISSYTGSKLVHFLRHSEYRALLIDLSEKSGILDDGKTQISAPRKTTTISTIFICPSVRPWPSVILRHCAAATEAMIEAVGSKLSDIRKPEWS